MSLSSAFLLFPAPMASKHLGALLLMTTALLSGCGPTFEQPSDAGTPMETPLPPLESEADSTPGELELDALFFEQHSELPAALHALAQLPVATGVLWGPRTKAIPEAVTVRGCGALVITPRHLLTAGHCLFGLLEAAGAAGEAGDEEVSAMHVASVEHLAVTGSLPSGAVTVESAAIIALHPEYSGQNTPEDAWVDLGLIVLEQPLPTSFAYRARFLTSLPARFDAVSLLGVGYGPQGEKSVGLFEMRRSDALYFRTGRQFEAKGGFRIEAGDSGGSLLWDEGPTRRLADAVIVAGGLSTGNRAVSVAATSSFWLQAAEDAGAPMACTPFSLRAKGRTLRYERCQELIR